MRRLFAALVSLLLALPALAGQSESVDAVTGILFEENMENVTYSLRQDGFVDILFGPAVAEADYVRIIERLRRHPDVPGVLAGHGKSDYCPVR